MVQAWPPKILEAQETPALPHLSCDVAIIGAGTAGLAAERSARRAGASTLLIDDRFAGTTCASVGCMPSKLLIAAAGAAHAIRRAGVFGVHAPDPEIDGAAVLQRVRTERDRFVQGVKRGMDHLPKAVMIKGRARFIDQTTLALEDDRRIDARAIVIATGSAPNIPKPFKGLGERVLTNETVFELATLPSSVAVIGAGPLGLEFAQALARLNVDVVVFDQTQRIAGLADAPVADALRKILEAEFPIHLGVDLSAKAGDDGVVLSWTGETSGERRFENLMVAAGRAPQLEDLDLARGGLALDEHGVPTFDRETLQCGDAPIFIAGDADRDRPVLHEASDEGTIAGANAAHYPRVTKGRRSPPFSIMFTDPTVAIIGAAPKSNDPRYVTGRASYEDQGRAKVMATNAGLIHIYADAKTGQLTGASMVGPAVEHTAHLIAWSIQENRTATQLLKLPFYHPTYEEGLRPALREICKAVHAATPDDRDEGAAPGA